MELPSMVERSGGRLVVRSLVSGATVYQKSMETSDSGTSARCGKTIVNHPLVRVELLERQLQLLNNQNATPALPSMLPVHMFLPSPSPSPLPKPMASGENKDSCKNITHIAKTQTEDDLPQCKIRRNYSCSACSFFTQNPRSHLSHLRDVHGENIVINECKLCMYASRHFQKLVRHMKMVHGCSDNDNSGVPGRRHCNREMRKRRLEESIVVPAVTAAGSGTGTDTSSAPASAGPSLKLLKMELEQQEQQLLQKVEEFIRHQQLQQMVSRCDNIFSMAFEFQLCTLPPDTYMGMGMGMGMGNNASGPSADELEREPQNSSSDSEQHPPMDDNATSEPLDLSAGSMPTQYQCKKCSYNTPIHARFKKHVKYHSMPLNKCSSCDFHSPYKWNLDRHTKNHGANGLFKCSVCDYSSNIKQSLTIHEYNHHVTNRPSAQELTSLKKQQELEQQLQQLQAQTNVSSSLEPSPDQEEPLETEIGSSPLDTNGYGSPPPEPLPISCPHCQQRMPNAIELASHLKLCHPALRNTTQLACDTDMGADEEYRSAGTDVSYCGVETAPGYGEVTDQLQPEDSDALKKVFKCPHCLFWAATASRFHVHIVGHLNRKPFECSLCSYRSNWRWDITKHIRLKAMRDKSHLHAEVLMNDETGRRNYAKYNQYITLLKVNAAQTSDAKTMRCGEIQYSAAENLLPHQPQHVCAETECMAALDLRVSSKPEPGQSDDSSADLGSQAPHPKQGKRHHDEGQAQMGKSNKSSQKKAT